LRFSASALARLPWRSSAIVIPPTAAERAGRTPNLCDTDQQGGHHPVRGYQSISRVAAQSVCLSGQRRGHHLRPQPATDSRNSDAATEHFADEFGGPASAHGHAWSSPYDRAEASAPRGAKSLAPCSSYPISTFVEDVATTTRWPAYSGIVLKLSHVNASGVIHKSLGEPTA
jgi:hypothetical protein